MYYSVDGVSFETIEDASEDFIKNRMVGLSEFATGKLTEVKQRPKFYGDDAWFGVGLDSDGDVEIASEEVECLADINIWFDEERETWSAVVHPMELSAIGEIQTNTSELTKLWEKK